MKSFKEKLTEFNRGLLRVHDREPLTPLSLIVIIFLDIFVLSVIFGGLSSHTEQLTAPDEFMPHVARSVFIDMNWSEVDRIAQVQQLALVDYNNYHYAYRKLLDKNKISKMHPKARELYAKTKALTENDELNKLLIDRQNLSFEMAKLNRDFARHKPMYDTALLERIAGEESVAIPSVAGRVAGRSEAFETAHARLAELDARIDRHRLTQDLWKTIAPGDLGQRDAITRDLRLYELKHAVIEFLWQLLFLLPIFGVFWFWYTKSLKSDNRIQILIASHLLVVAAIPIFGKTVELVIDLIPKYFFKKLFELLEQLHIIAVWHYLLIGLAILAALALIYIIQKKIFNRENLYRQRLERGQCYACGKKIPSPTDKMCAFCGESQFKSCGSCGKETYVAGKRCAHCGTA